MISASGASRSASISRYTICASGQNVTSSSNGLDRPARTLTSSRESAEEFLDDPCLADAGLAEQGHQVRAFAHLHAFERVGEQRQLARRSTRWSDVRVGGPARSKAGHAAIAPSKPLASTGRTSPNRTPLPTSCRVARTHQHLARLGSLLEPCADVDLGADHDVRSVAVPTATRPVFTPTRTWIGIVRPSLAPNRDARSTICKPGSDPPHRIVVVHGRHAEHAQHRVTDEHLRPVPPNAEISSLTMPWNAASTSRNRSGSSVCRELGRSREVGEDHRHDTPFRRRRDPDRGAAVGQKLASGGSVPAARTRLDRRASGWVLTRPSIGGRLSRSDTR